MTHVDCDVREAEEGSTVPFVEQPKATSNELLETSPNCLLFLSESEALQQPSSNRRPGRRLHL